MLGVPSLSKVANGNSLALAITLSRALLINPALAVWVESSQVGGLGGTRSVQARPSSSNPTTLDAVLQPL